MTGYRKCGHALEHGDSTRRVTWVNRAAGKIMAEGPDELTSLLTWTALAGAFVLLLLGATCLALSFGSSTRPSEGEPPASACATAMQLCSLCRIPRAAANPSTGSACRTSGLTSLPDVGPNDVHYVFADVATAPAMALCSVESALRAAGNGSRVNVFVVRDVEDAASQSDTPQRNPVSLSKYLSQLSIAYGTGRLNVVRVGLEECVECSPLRNTLPDLRRRPGLAEFAAQLAVLWQFGGTVLDPGVVAVRDRVYRANGSAVEYGERTVSAPAACSASVYDAMLRCVASCASPSDRPQRWREPRFGPDAAQEVWNATTARPAPPWIVGHGDAVAGPSPYYVETDRDDNDASFSSFCPGILQASRRYDYDFASAKNDV